MSETMLALAKSFADKRLSADEFSSAYMELWRFERDNHILQKDGYAIASCLSGIFCMTDLYNPHPNRDDYEVSEVELRAHVSALLSAMQ